MASKEIEAAVSELRQIQAQHEPSIVKLSETITGSDPDDFRQRSSDASSVSLEKLTPRMLEADLAHYSELFAKLRFSYVEQVTKEKFIRAIVGDPPLIVTAQENQTLETENAEAKSNLKLKKTEVANAIAELEKKSRELSQQYEKVQEGTRQLHELPGKIRDLEREVEHFESSLDAPGSDPNLHLPLGKTMDLVAERKVEQQALAREIETLQAKVPRKKKELERLETELQPLEAKLRTSSAAAREARKCKEAALGGFTDDLEQRARWYKASKSILRSLHPL